MASPKPGTPRPLAADGSPPSAAIEEQPGKSFVAFRVVMPEKDGTSPNFLFSGALAYYTFTLGIGLLILGSILTYVLNDQPRQTYDPFSKNLTVTAILFLIIGSLLIISTMLKCMYPWCQTVRDTEVTETNIQPNSIAPENTILYNPFYPPILVPYNVNNLEAQQNPNYPSSGNCQIAIPKGNTNLLPGSMIFAEECDNAGKEKAKALEAHLSDVMDISTNTLPLSAAEPARNSAVSNRGQEQILQVEHLRFNDQKEKF